MALRLPTATQNAMANAMADRVDAGGAAGTIEIYSGAQPATANDAATGTLLATFTLPYPAFGDASGGVANLLGVPLSTTGSAAGTPGWFRAKDSTGATAFDGSVGTSGAQLNLNTTSITAGGQVQITSGSDTQPAQ